MLYFVTASIRFEDLMEGAFGSELAIKKGSEVIPIIIVCSKLSIIIFYTLQLVWQYAANCFCMNLDLKK